MNPKYAVPLFFWCFLSLFSGRVLAEDKVQISADRLEVNHKESRALFVGRVRATFGQLRLECQNLQVRYNEAGQVSHLEAAGSVSVKREDTSATAGRATLNVNRAILVLEGNPKVARGPHKLSGVRITIELSTGRMDIEHARGTFELPTVAEGKL